MVRNVRPSGLSTLAIFNFIFSGLLGLSGLMRLGALLTPDVTPTIFLTSALNLAIMALLIVSGVGYLTCHPIVGRLLGSVYALADIAKTVLALAFFSALKPALSIFAVGELIWPLVTLFFLNIVFRDVWRRRARMADLAGKETPDRGTATKKNPPHLILVMLQSVRQTLRSTQGLFFILIALFVCLVTVEATMMALQGGEAGIERQAPLNNAQRDREMNRQIQEAAYKFFVWLLDESPPSAARPPARTIALSDKPDAWADYLSSEKPALLSILFAVMMTVFPILSAFLVFNQISLDARRKGFRYLLLRTRRSSIYLGKYLACLAVIIPIIVLAVAAVAFFVLLGVHFYPAGEVIAWSLWAVVMIIFVTAPSIAFCLFFSALINNGFGSLAASAWTLGLFPLLARLLKDQAPPLVFLQYFLPQKVACFLMHPQWWVVLLAAAGCCLYTAAFAAGGNLYFKRKSL